MITCEEQARAFVSALCEPKDFAKVEAFVTMLTAESARQNLVSAGSLKRIWQRHIADSAQLIDLVPRGTLGTWLDLGTGAGFPGMVIAAMCPGIPVCLVESRRLRADWLRAMTEALRLSNCSVRGQRIETVESFKAAVISARAFAPLDRLIHQARRFSTSDTKWLLPKGRSAAQELGLLPHAVRQQFHVEQSHTDADAGIIVGWIGEPTPT